MAWWPAVTSCADLWRVWLMLGLVLGLTLCWCTRVDVLLLSYSVLLAVCRSVSLIVCVFFSVSVFVCLLRLVPVCSWQFFCLFVCFFRVFGSVSVFLSSTHHIMYTTSYHMMYIVFCIVLDCISLIASLSLSLSLFLCVCEVEESWGGGRGVRLSERGTETDRGRQRRTDCK